jgi:hypothetical protein
MAHPEHSQHYLGHTVFVDADRVDLCGRRLCRNRELHKPASGPHGLADAAYRFQNTLLEKRGK